ncbi:P-loop containing nucleoside triphosphate hydrolase protein [Hymenopellis radicata]|nr:P-loop containing nucleoside triphosphate hydrolase protein [Hymenopellis radicata]
MDKDAQRLSELLVSNLSKIPATQRLLVGICGIPASGKSTFAELVEERVNGILKSDPANADRAILVGMDGFHFTRAQLDAFPDPKLAHDRRGSHWTFDAAAYLAFMQTLRLPLGEDAVVITAPTFDHAVKDPMLHGVSIHRHHRIVLIEGLYTCLSVGHWGEAARLLDEKWYIRVDASQAKRRLVKRHVKTGITKDLEEAHWRAESNDRPNGVFILENMVEPTQIVESVEDPVFTVGDNAGDDNTQM